MDLAYLKGKLFPGLLLSIWMSLFLFLFLHMNKYVFIQMQHIILSLKTRVLTPYILNQSQKY